MSTITLSAWGEWPLNEAQLRYAAIDVVASLEVFAFALEALRAVGGTQQTSRAAHCVPAELEPDRAFLYR